VWLDLPCVVPGGPCLRRHRTASCQAGDRESHSSSPEIGAQITKSLVNLYENTKEEQKTYREGLKKLAEYFEGELKDRMLPMAPK
jgi:hypothetical protein